MIENILNTEKIPYRLIDNNEGFKLIKINSKHHLFYMNSRNTQFLMERDFFEYLDENSIPYSVLCHDISKNNYYYLKFKKKANWIKSYFGTCDKDSIYLGKQVLNSRVSEKELCDVLKKLM